MFVFLGKMQEGLRLQDFMRMNPVEFFCVTDQHFVQIYEVRFQLGSWYSKHLDL